VAKSFFATLKKELVHGCAFETRSEAYDAISDYIENYYNAKRRPSAARNLSPINFELANAAQIAGIITLRICPETPGNSTIPSTLDDQPACAATVSQRQGPLSITVWPTKADVQGVTTGRYQG
jgi:hypothetical protein